MVKYKQLKRKLLIELGIITAAVLGVTAILMYLSSMTDSYQGSIQTLEGEVNEIASTTSALRTKYNEVHNTELYQQAKKKNGGGGSYINRELIRDGFNTFKDRFHLDSLHLTMSPEAPMKDAKYHRPTHQADFSDIDITFYTLSDEFIYSLIMALDKDLPGTSKIVKLELTREAPVDDVSLKTIRTKGAYNLVKGELKLIWFGITPIETAGGTDAPKP